MLLRFYFLFILGLISILAIIFFGDIGIKSLALFALYPIIERIRKKEKMDERELQLFYKVGNYTIVVVILAIILISKTFSFSVNENIIGNYWEYLMLASVLFGQGVIGIIFYYKES